MSKPPDAHAHAHAHADVNGVSVKASDVDPSDEVDVNRATTPAEHTAGLPPEIRMGQDITRGLRHLPEAEAAEQIATHLRKFWEPRMRRALVQRVRKGDPRIDPLLDQAVRQYIVGDIDQTEVSEPSGG
ncbi:MAG: formate dehydrogenase subunit delta [Ornithinimicrobium sp.]